MALNNDKKVITHISGLRAIAILMVVFFHCFSKFKNGFLGVDVFLVISGYFLFRDFWNENNSFDIKHFLFKKIKRLFPLAAVVSILCCVVSLCFSCDLTLRTAKSALTTLLGCSNLYYDYTFADYFASSARLNPLVHTWYLSLTVQIFLIYACICYMAQNRTRRLKMILLAVVSIISLLIYYSGIWIPKISSQIFTPSTYYWTSGRLWIVCVGAFAHFLPRLRCGYLVGVISLLLLIIMGLSPYVFSPGGAIIVEILTIVSSSLVIAYGGEGVGSSFLNHRSFQMLGKVSFSLYLVHWPIIVFFSYVSSAYGDNYVRMVKILEILISVLLAVVVYYAIENKKMRFSSYTILFAMGIGLVALLIQTNGLHGYIHPGVDAVHAVRYAETKKCHIIESGALYDSLPDFRRETHHGGQGASQYLCERIPLLYGIGTHPENADFILIGDSHAEALYPGFDVIAKGRGWNGVYLHTYIIPLIGVYSEYRPYQRWDRSKAESFLLFLKRNPQIETVFIANRWFVRFSNTYINWDGEFVSGKEKNYDCLKSFLERIRAMGKRVVVFADVPCVPNPYPLMYVRRQVLFHQPIDKQELTCSQELYDSHNRDVNEQLEQWEQSGLCKVLHPESVLLQDGGFSCLKGNLLYYMDGDHLSFDGSVKCMQALEPHLSKIFTSDKE